MAKKKTDEKFDKQSFIKTFNSIALHKHRYEVFADFVKMSAIALHNGVVMDEKLEAEYLEIVGKYSKEEADKLCKLLANLVVLLQLEPVDILGQLYMELELNSDNTAQFFSPACIAELMAKISCGNLSEQLKSKPFITVSEPACGAGGMILAFAKEVLQQKYNPAEKMWVQCVDIDRVAAFMCYIQLSLWNIPAQVVVGNSLTLEVREVFYTPAHYLFGWEQKFRIQKAFDLIRNLGNEPLQTESPKQEVVETKPKVEKSPPPKREFTGEDIQFDLFMDHSDDKT